MSIVEKKCNFTSETTHWLTRSSAIDDVDVVLSEVELEQEVVYFEVFQEKIIFLTYADGSCDLHELKNILPEGTIESSTPPKIDGVTWNENFKS